MKFKSFAVFSLAACIALAGAGCGAPSDQPTTQEPTGPKPTNFESMSPEEATENINFIPGSVIEMRQAFLGFGSNLSAKTVEENKEAIRLIVIDRFAPFETANLTWKLITRVETDASMEAREQAEQAGEEIPEPELLDLTAVGNLDGINLKNTIGLFLPGFWPEREHASALEYSGIWLPLNIFEGLERNRIATLQYGILDPSLQGRVRDIKEFQNAFSNLEAEQNKIQERHDIYLLTGEHDLVEWPLNVNGQDIKVEAIRARNWFGEIVVLNNKQNPLVLKFAFNPQAVGNANPEFEGAELLKSLLDYEITRLIDVLP